MPVRFKSCGQLLPLLLLIMAWAVPQSLVAQWGVSQEVQAREGDAIDGGGTFSSFQYPQINNNGSVAFTGFTSGLAACPSSVNLFRVSSGVLQTPTCYESVVSGGVATVLGDDGHLAWLQFNQVRSDVGGAHDVANRSDPVPGFPADKFDLFSGLAANTPGQVVFWGSTDVNNKQGIWAEPAGSGTLKALILEGDAAPALEATTFKRIIGTGLALNDSGVMLFTAETTAAFGTGIWTVDMDNTVRKVIAPVDPLPSTAGTFGSSQERPAGINDQGEVTFTGTTSVPNEQGVWAERWNEMGQAFDLYKVVLTGDSIAINDGVSWQPLEFHSPAINNAGDVGFVGCSRLAAIRICGIVRAVWNGTGFDLQPIAIDSRVAGARRGPAGGGLYIPTSQTYNMNNTSQFAFRAQTDNNGSNFGMWGWRPEFGLLRIFMASQPFLLPDGETRLPINNTTSMANLVTSGGSDGRPRHLADGGKVVIALDLDSIPTGTDRLDYVIVGDLNETLFRDSLEWQWAPPSP